MVVVVFLYEKIRQSLNFSITFPKNHYYSTFLEKNLPKPPCRTPLLDTVYWLITWPCWGRANLFNLASNTALDKMPTCSKSSIYFFRKQQQWYRILLSVKTLRYRGKTHWKITHHFRHRKLKNYRLKYI